MTEDFPPSSPPSAAFNDPLDFSRKNYTRPLVISPNLSAALEYDEQTRNNAHIPGPSGRRMSEADIPLAGLPPPPRPKSRTNSVRRIKSPPTSPASAPIAMADKQSPPPVPTSPTPSSIMQPSSSPPVSFSNPFINPPPRLAHLVTESSPPPPFTFPADRRSLADHSPRSSIESRICDSPRSDTRPSHSPVQATAASSPESAEATKPTFQRHLRYLSSLSKVDKLLVIGKTLAGGKSEAKQQKIVGAGRRGSDASFLEEEVPDKLGRDVAPVTARHRRKLVRGRSSSSGGSASTPSSPIVCSPDVFPQTTGSFSSSTSDVPPPAEKDPARRSAGILPVAEQPSVSMVLATRPILISHARHPSAASTLRSTASSESSHDPPSTPNDTRISISSTIYQDSHYSIPFDPPFSPPLPTGRSTDIIMDSPPSDRESFIDLASPRSPEFNVNQHTDRFSRDYRTDLANLADLSSKRPPPILNTSGTKPPLPTSPKPNFDSPRSRSMQPPHQRRHGAPDSPEQREHGRPSTRPSTTNLLNPKERADRVRQNRKLAQVFGQTPGAMEARAAAVAASHEAHADASVPTGLRCAPVAGLSTKQHRQLHPRGAVSMSVNTGGPSDAISRAVWPPPEGTKRLTLGVRRHSSPLTPDAVSFLEDTDDADEEDDPRRTSAVIEIGPAPEATHDGGEAGRPLLHRRSSSALTSPTSFIDWSEEDTPADGVSSIISLQTPTADRRPALPATLSSSASIYSLTPEELDEEERRRKREKLARLHRFLGSRVPTDLVLQQLSINTALDLPPAASETVSAVERPKQQQQMDAEARRVWVRRRRSSSAAEFGGRWSDDIDRLKEDLNDKEKAQNVKRALKMEKMFGVAPPQTLYHTRAVPVSPGFALPPVPSPSTKQPRSSYTSSSPLASPRNANQSPYTRNKIKKKGNRPGTADSAEPLMGERDTQDGLSRLGFSEVYEHYRHSLNSLNDIIDRDDKASLERLHDLIHSDGHEPRLQTFARHEDDQQQPESPRTPKAERRRSLPSRTSMTSLSSEFSIAATITSPDPEEMSFQARRRRAAKLTQFFGVDYRELMAEILESLERGLEEERGLGTLDPHEVQELLSKLRRLKSRRSAFLG
ncbi:hypothetical protein BDW22DRAFT_1424350 [Trametopsis cervina]|nr:hypothetical protein BDW22DRAFT_1424350 [Trametopsis cervina]